MPIIDLERPDIRSAIDTPTGFAVTPGADDINHGSEKPDFGSVMGAAFRQDNTVGSYLASETVPAAVEPDFNAWENIKGTPYEPHWKSFVDARSSQAADAIKRQIDREEEDRRTLSAAPWYQSVPAQMAAGVIDLPTLLPGGAFVRGARGGMALAKSAMSVGAAAGASSAAQEALLHYTQETRPLSESAQNIGASVFLGGLLGSAGSFLSRAEWNRAVRAIEADIGGKAMDDAALPQPAAAGAAAVKSPTIEENAIAGRAAGAVAAATARLNPILRLLQSDSGKVREVAADLMENPLYLKKNMDFVKSGHAAETLMQEWNGGLAQALQARKVAYEAYWKDGGRMSETEFSEAVGRALRRGDVDENPHVQQAAQAARAKVFEPLKRAAIEAKLLPEDVSVETADSYFTRVWNKNKLIANEGKAKAIFADYFTRLLGDEYEKSSTSFRRKMAKLEQERIDLNLTPEKRSQVLGELDAAGREHEASWPTLSEAADRLSDIRSDLRRARELGQGQEISRLKKEEASVYDEFPKGALKAFLETRTSIRSRRRNVDLGFAGLQDRSDRLLGQLADIEESNFRAMERLVKKGQKLERDLDRLDADALEQRITDLAESYSKIAAKADASVERARKEIENINKRAAKAETRNIEKGAEISAESDKKIIERVQREAIKQQELSSRMALVAERLELVKGLDHDAIMEELKDAITRSMRETSASSMDRGARAARLGERLQKLTPERIAGRMRAIEAMQRSSERSFYDKWEVKRLGGGVDPSTSARADFTEAARAAADDVFGRLTGSASDEPRPDFITITARGPLKERTFNIPDHLVEDFLDHNVDDVMRRYTRVMGSDVELANKFGSVDMKEQLQAVRDDYAKLSAETKDEKKLLALKRAADRDIADLKNMRDVLRGMTLQKFDVEKKFDSIVRGANHFNYLRAMGEVTLSSLTDAVRPAMVHGLGQYMQTVGQLATNMRGIKMSVKEAQLGGNVLERVLHNRLATITEITDPLSPRGPVESFLHNMTNFASKWNGIRLWTDMQKSMAAVMTQNRILTNSVGYANAAAKEKRYLAYLGIDQSMAERIAGQFEKHGQTVDGVKVANTEAWTDNVARRTYRAAMNKDVDSIVVEKGIGDVPTIANTPTGRSLLQFKSFALASHQRILLRGLQEDKSRFIGGVAAMTAMGMLISYLKAISGNRPEMQERMLNNPGWWIAEGLDRSGILSVPMELSNAFEKFSGGFNPIKAPLKVFDESSSISQKNQSRPDIGPFLGPTVGMGADILTAGGIPRSVAQGEEVTKGQRSAAERLLPFNSYAGVRQMLRYLFD